MSKLAMGVPMKVRRTAAELGMHADCWAAGEDGLCARCNHILYAAFDLHYAHHGSIELAAEAMIDDLLADV